MRRYTWIDEELDGSKVNSLLLTLRGFNTIKLNNSLMLVVERGQDACGRRISMECP